MKHATLLLIALAPIFAHAEVCQTNGAVFDANATPPPNVLEGTPAEWRDGSTNFNQAGGITDTDGNRERQIKAKLGEMVADITGGRTPFMEWFPEKGVGVEYLVETTGYGSHIVDKVKISNVGKAGLLNLTLLLAVSGHVGNDKATRNANSFNWAQKDTYDVDLQVADAQGNFGTIQHLIQGAKSQGMVTAQELQVPLQKGVTLRLTYNRSGSAGPSGYIEGRALDLVWNGK